MFLVWSSVLVVAVLLYLYKTYSRFRNYGVKHHMIVPFLGNMWRIIFKLYHTSEDVDMLYNDFPDERFVGRYEFNKPVVVIKELELLKKILVKDFEHFLDHRLFFDSNNDGVFGRNLFSLRGQEWKEMRSALSPAFTSSKIRLMVPFMEEAGEQMINALKQNIESSKDDYLDVDVKEMTSRYSNDVIATCAFGLKVDSHQDVNNQFYAMGKEVSNLSFIKLLLFLAYSTFPKLMNYLQISILSDATKSFFRKLVLNTIQDREEKNIIRPDMIHLLMEAKKGRLTHDDEKSFYADSKEGFATDEESSIGNKATNRVWSDKDLIAQAVIFFIAGFETVSTGSSFLLYELALHPEVQEKLFQEIRQMDEKNDGKFDYNAIQNMKYMDMVVSESLRLWPPVSVLDRICTIDYNMGKPNDKANDDFIIRKGEGIQIPAWSFHRDPQYFPDPLKFDPERFSEENKDKIQPFSYIPFGMGPRTCIGSRFTLCEIKVMTYLLLRTFQVAPCSKTQIPAKLSKDSFSPNMQGGNWVRFTTRT